MGDWITATSESGLERIAQGTGRSLGTVVNEIKPHSVKVSNPLSVAEKFFSETQNPYAANLVLNSAKHPELITVDEAVEKIHEGTEGLIHVSNRLNMQIVFGGGGPKCFYHIGTSDMLQNEFGFNPGKIIGVSGGSFPALFYALAMQENKFGLDTSSSGLKQFCMGLRDTLGIDFLRNLKEIERHPRYLQFAHKIKNNAKKVYTFIMSQLVEGIIDRHDLEGALSRSFGHMTLADVPRFETLVTRYLTGESSILNSNTAPNEPVSSAVMKTIAYPGLFAPIRDSNGTWTDGAYHGIPMDFNGNLTLVSILNYFVPHPKREIFSGIQGKVDQRSLDHAIMGHRNIDLTIRNLTKQSPEYVLEHGDPKGRIILILPNLSHIGPLDYYGDIDTLIEMGKNARPTLEKVLDPAYQHPEYDAPTFSFRLRRDIKPKNL